MTDKEFKRLSRPQLIDIIYQLQVRQEELIAENDRLSRELLDKRLRVDRAGNIAEAAMEVNGVMQAAQDAAAQYLEEIRHIHSETEKACQNIVAHAQEEAAGIVAQARAEAANITAQAKKSRKGFDPLVEAIMEEFK